MKIAVVDDRADALAGRTAWLREAGHHVVPYTFDEALAEADWQDFDTVVLDGRDDRVRPHIFNDTVPDRFLGPRVAHQIRQGAETERPVIVLISMYCRSHPELAWRCLQAGVTYTFEYNEVATAEDFVSVATTPESRTQVDAPNWRQLGFSREPRVEQAIKTIEGSPASAELLQDVRPSMRATAYESRSLRERLDFLLPIPLTSTSTRARKARRSELRPVIRRLLGLRPDEKF